MHIATRSFLTALDGHRVVVAVGQTVREGHPLLEGREHYFKPFSVDYDLPAPADEKPKRTRTKKAEPDPGETTKETLDA